MPILSRPIACCAIRSAFLKRAGHTIRLNNKGGAESCLYARVCGENNRSIELLLIPGSSSLAFEVRQSARTDAPLTAYSAFVDGCYLIVPEIWIGNVSYWADLRETGPGHYVMDSFGRNQQAVSPRTQPYQHQVWEWLPGEALDIGVGADGTAWAVGTRSYDYDDDYGYGYEYDNSLNMWDGYDWYEMGGSAIRVDVDPLGRPWVINHDDEIFRSVGF